MQRKQVFYLVAILVMVLAMLPLGAAAEPATPNSGAAETVGNPQLPTARDAKLALDGPAAPAAPPANPAAILYDNGPLTTHPGGGAGGANASALQTALGLTTLRLRPPDLGPQPRRRRLHRPGRRLEHQHDHLLRLPDRFDDDHDDQQRQPADLERRARRQASVVFGDTTTNRLAGSSFSNIYRVLDTGLTDTARPIMADVVTVNTTLPAGTYWLDWQTGGTLASGPWAPPVSILGQTGKPGANGATVFGWRRLCSGSGRHLPAGPALRHRRRQAATGPSISLAKTVGTTPGVCATHQRHHRARRHHGLLLLRGDQHRRRGVRPAHPDRRRPGHDLHGLWPTPWPQARASTRSRPGCRSRTWPTRPRPTSAPGWPTTPPAARRQPLPRPRSR